MNDLECSFPQLLKNSGSNYQQIFEHYENV